METNFLREVMMVRDSLSSSYQFGMMSWLLPLSLSNEKIPGNIVLISERKYQKTCMIVDWILTHLRNRQVEMVSQGR